MGGSYNLDEFLDSQTINKRLQKAPKFKRGLINYDNYLISDAHLNSIKFLEDELLFER
jgi:hypothetical protein